MQSLPQSARKENLPLRSPQSTRIHSMQQESSNSRLHWDYTLSPDPLHGLLRFHLAITNPPPTVPATSVSPSNGSNATQVRRCMCNPSFAGCHVLPSSELTYIPFAPAKSWYGLSDVVNTIRFGSKGSDATAQANGSSCSLFHLPLESSLHNPRLSKSPVRPRQTRTRPNASQAIRPSDLPANPRKRNFLRLRA